MTLIILILPFSQWFLIWMQPIFKPFTTSFADYALRKFETWILLVCWTIRFHSWFPFSHKHLMSSFRVCLPQILHEKLNRQNILTLIKKIKFTEHTQWYIVSVWNLDKMISVGIIVEFRNLQESSLNQKSWKIMKVKKCPTSPLRLSCELQKVEKFVIFRLVTYC